jgi:predicted ester cyclase
MASTPDALIRQWFDQLWNQGDPGTIDRMLSPDSKVFGLTPDGQPIVGPAAFRSFYEQFRTGFPGLHVTVERTVTEGNLVAAHCHCTGTQWSVPRQERPHKPVDFRGMVIVRIANGLFVEGWNTFDFLSCYQQIDLLPMLEGQA